MAKPTISIADLKAAAKARHSPLYTWMLDNHDQFKEVVTEAVRPNWPALAASFSSQGLTDANDKPPTGEVVRQTWWRVRKAVDARSKRKKSPNPAIPKKETTPDAQPRRDTFNFSATPKEDDKTRLFGKPKSK
jgi:hypothetical protein